MLVDEGTLRHILGIGAEEELEIEDAGGLSRAERVAVRGAEGGEREYVVRADVSPERAMNHAAVIEALDRAGFDGMPRLAGLTGTATIEEAFPGLPLIHLRAELPTMELAIDAIARMHALPVREGLDWERERSSLVLEAEPELFRLGFASHEREPAMEAFRAAHDILAATPFGFAHRDLTASNILLGRDAVRIVNFGSAGYGPQLFDVASLLATGGVPAQGRARLAARYGAAVGMPEQDAVDLVDLATIAWGVREEIGLPRRQIEVMGDETGMEQLIVQSTRTQQALREPAGDHPLAATIRAALWPNRG